MGYHERPDRRGGVGGPKQLLGKPANCTGNCAGRRGKPSAVLLFGTRQAIERAPVPPTFRPLSPTTILGQPRWLKVPFDFAIAVDSPRHSPRRILPYLHIRRRRRTVVVAGTLPVRAVRAARAVVWAHTGTWGHYA